MANTNTLDYELQLKIDLVNKTLANLQKIINNIKPEITLESSKIQNQIQKLKVDLAGLGNQKIDLQIKSETVLNSIKKVQLELNSLNSKPLTPEIQLKIDNAELKLKQFENNLSKIKGAEAKVYINENSINAQIQKLETNLQNGGQKVGKALSDGIEKSTSGISSRLTGIFDIAIGNFAANLATQGFNKVLDSTKEFVSSSVNLFNDYKKSITTLEIISPRFNIDAKKAQVSAESLAKELRLGVGTTAESLQNLFKSGLNLEQASDLLRRFTNEAITGKSSTISLDQAVQNLAFGYNTQNSAIGNLSGISENFSDIQERGLKILQKQGQLLGKTIGTLDEAGKKQAQYAGIIDLTNLTLGSSAKFQGSFIDNQAILNQTIAETQRRFGAKLDPFLNEGIKALIPLVQSLSDSLINVDLNAIVNNLSNFGKKINFDSIIQSAQNFGTSIGDLFNSISVNPAVISSIDSLTTAFVNVANFLPTVLNLVSQFFNFISQNQTVISAFAIGLSVFVTGFAAFSIVTSIIGTIGSLTTGFTALTGAIAAAGGVLSFIVGILGGPITITIVAITALITGFYLAWSSNFLGIRDITSNVFNGIVNVISSVFNTVINIFNTVSQSIIAVVSGLFLIIIGLFTGNTQLISNVWQGLGSTLKNIWGGTIENLKNATLNLVNNIANAFNDLKNKISVRVENAINYLKGINLAEIGRNMIQGLANGVSSAAGAIRDSVKNAVDGAIKAAKDVLGIKSPSRVFATIGLQTGEGFIKGMSNIAKEMQSTVSDALDFRGFAGGDSSDLRSSQTINRNQNSNTTNQTFNNQRSSNVTIYSSEPTINQISQQYRYA